MGIEHHFILSSEKLIEVHDNEKTYMDLIIRLNLLDLSKNGLLLLTFLAFLLDSQFFGFQAGHSFLQTLTFDCCSVDASVFEDIGI